MALAFERCLELEFVKMFWGLLRSTTASFVLRSEPFFR